MALIKVHLARGGEGAAEIRSAVPTAYRVLLSGGFYLANHR